VTGGRGRPLAALAAAAVLAAAGAAHASDWTEYTAFLWHYKGPPKDERLAAAMKSLGIAGSNVDGLESTDFATKNGLRFYADHVAGKGILYLRKEDYQPVWDAWFADRDPRRLVRPNCLNDPATVKKLRELVKARVEKHRGAGPLAYALDDEISITSFANPFDFCFCAHCLARFSAELREEYVEIASLNAEWGTSFRRFDEARPQTTDEIRARMADRPRSEWNLAPWADHRAFMDRTLARTVADLVAFCRELDPAAPAGFVGGQAPNAFGGHDWSLLVPAVGFLEVYDIGSAREIVRSLDERRIPIVSTYFPSAPGEEWKNVYRLHYLFAHGDRGAILWSAEDAFASGDASKPAAYVRAMAPALKDLSSPALAPLLGARPVHDGIAILYSPASVRVHWMLDSWDDKATWPKRYGSFERDHSSLYADWEAWRKLLEDLGYQYRFVSSREVEAGALERDGYRALVLPKAIALSGMETAVIESFARGGGLVVADCQAGLFDGHGRARGLVGSLDALFGVKRGDVLVSERYGTVRPLAREAYEGLVVMEPGVAAASPGTRPKAAAAGIPVVLSRDLEGGGRAVYLNLAVAPYREERGAPRGGEALRSLVAEILQRSGISPPVRVEATGRPGARIEGIRAFGADGAEYLTLLQNGGFSVGPTGKSDLVGVAPGPPIDVRVVLSEPRRVVSLKTGRVVGEGRSFRDALVSLEMSAYRLDPLRR